jgi:hypothetical protein
LESPAKAKQDARNTTNFNLVKIAGNVENFPNTNPLSINSNISIFIDKTSKATNFTKRVASFVFCYQATNPHYKIDTASIPRFFNVW